MGMLGSQMLTATVEGTLPMSDSAGLQLCTLTAGGKAW